MKHGHRRTWLITGCSSGLGLALAHEVAARGDTVVATARRASALQALVTAWPDNVLPLALDVTDPGQVTSVVAEATQTCGAIDVLVNNAGRVQIGAVEEVSDAELRALFDVHLFGPTNLVRAVLPQMRERRNGVVVQMSSMGSFFISPGFSAYTATKAALEGLSATLAIEVAPFGIRVVIVEPGTHRTSVFSEQQAGFASEMAAYADVVGPTRQFIAAADGHQHGDPVRAAGVIADVVTRGAPPLRLPLGADAVVNITQALRSIAANIEEWEEVARSTAYSAAPSDPPEQLVDGLGTSDAS